MNNKVLSLLGLAKRAGKLEAGFDVVVAAARDGRARLLLAAEDVSDKTFKNICYEAQRAGISAVRINADMAQTGKACGVRAGVLAVTDEGFANALLKQPTLRTEDKEENTL